MAKTKPYTAGKWKGLANYECELCPFKTPDETVMLDHQMNRHPSGEPAQPATVDADAAASHTGARPATN